MFEREYRGLIEAYEKAGGEPDALKSREIGNVVIHNNKVLSANECEGIRVETEETETGVNIHFLVEEGAKIKHPVHMCFGILPREGLQEIVMRISVKPDAEVEVIAHCIFPNAVHVVHRMDANVDIGENARFRYQETHYHGEDGGIEVIPRAKVRVGRGATYENTFSLIKGRVGRLDIDYDVACDERSITELVAKVYGKGEDDIRIADRMHLDGDGARGIIKTRVALTDKAKSEVIGETYGNAPNSRGHMDCVEILNGKEAVAKAIPIVVVNDERAKVTHEAAIGSVDRKQMETLMARGLDEEEAVDVIVKGILR